MVYPAQQFQLPATFPKRTCHEGNPSRSACQYKKGLRSRDHRPFSLVYYGHIARLYIARTINMGFNPANGEA
jgi:hypothetical protein